MKHLQPKRQAKESEPQENKISFLSNDLRRLLISDCALVPLLSLELDTLWSVEQMVVAEIHAGIPRPVIGPTIIT